MTSVPTITLNDGHTIPQLGFGVFKVDPDETERIVTDALEVGYRHIDTAAIYGNEEGVGAAIADVRHRRATSCSSPRSCGTATRARSRRSTRWTSRSRSSASTTSTCTSSTGRAPTSTATSRPGSRSSSCKADGKTRSIGVSNFHAPHLERVLAERHVVPAVDQIELHPAFAAARAARVRRRARHPHRGVGPARPGQVRPASARQPVTDAAAAHGATPAQVVIRWHLQNGHHRLPEVELARAHGRELRRVRLRAHAPTRSPRSTRSTAVSASAPTPTTVDLLVRALRLSARDRRLARGASTSDARQRRRTPPRGRRGSR